MKALAVCMMLATALVVVAVPSAVAEPQCMDVYRETHVGPVTIIQRSSCEAEVCVEDAEGNCESPKLE